MFSRTTMASSISRPMHSDSAIRVKKFSVKPKAFMAMKLASTEIGRVRPVMMVERHECRNRKTITMVSTAPSMMVRLTLLSWLCTRSDSSSSTRRVISGGRVFCRSAATFRMPVPTSTTLASCTLVISMVTACWPFMREIDSSSCSPSTTVATWSR